MISENERHMRQALGAALVTGAIFLYYVLIGTGGMAHGYTAGRILICFLLFFIVQVVTDSTLLSRAWLPAIPVSVFWTLLFPAVIVASRGNLQTNIGAFGRYILVGPVLAVLLFLLARIGTGRRKGFAIGISGILMLLFTAIPFIYGAYWMVYGNTFVPGDMEVLRQTHPQEIMGYLVDVVGGSRAAIFLVALLAYGGLNVFLLHKGYQGPVYVCRCGWKQYFLWFLLLAGIIASIAPWVRGGFPLAEWREFKAYRQGIEKALLAHEGNAGRLVLDTAPGLPQTLPGTVILIIGESANRDHMDAFSGNHHGTTPWLTGQKEAGKVYLFPRSYGNYCHTIEVLSQLLTDKNQYNGRPLDETIHILDVAKKAGYTTWWMTNQGLSGDGSTITGLVAESADHTLETPHPGGDDRQLLELLRQVPEEGNHFIVLHIMGSHTQYSERYPRTFAPFGEEKEENKEGEYDTTLVYTDNWYRDVYRYATDHLHLQTLVYVSDHSEDMEYSHGAGHFLWSMVRIPLFITLSDAYEAAYPETARALRSNEGQVFTNDLIFDLLCGLMHTKNNFYEETYDLSSPAYTLPVEKALTMHGERHITEDPDL